MPVGNRVGPGSGTLDACDHGAEFDDSSVGGAGDDEAGARQSAASLPDAGNSFAER